MSLFESLKTLVRKRHDDDAKSFDELALQIADGREPKAESVYPILEAAGKTPDDLEKAVAVVLRRREISTQLAAIANATNEAKKVEAKIAATQAELDEFTKTKRAELNAMQEPLLILQTQAGRERALRDELFATAKPELLAENERLGAELRSFGPKLQTLESALNQWAEELAVIERRVATSEESAARRHDAELLDARRRDIADGMQQVSPLRARRLSIMKRLDEIRSAAEVVA